MPLRILPMPRPRPRPLVMREVNKVVVTGGRDFDNRTFIYRVLNEVLDTYGFSYLIEGDAPGLDKIAGFWARKTLGESSNIKYPADWNNIYAEGAVIRTRADGSQFNVLAGKQRNQQILDEERPDLALIFPGNSGTMDMFERVRKAGIPYITVYYPGEYSGRIFGEKPETRVYHVRNS